MPELPTIQQECAQVGGTSGPLNPGAIIYHGSNAYRYTGRVRPPEPGEPYITPLMGVCGVMRRNHVPTTLPKMILELVE